MENLKTGVIGLGRMGQHHCRVYASQREAQLVGFYDINLQIAKDFSLKYDVPAFQRIDDLLEQVGAVSIATPTPTHFDLVMRCLEHGVHVLVEKPVTDSLENAEQLARAVERSGLIVQVGHIERFNPTYLELKNVIECIKVIAVNFRRLSPYKGSNKDVDVVLDLMVHDLDLSLDLAGREPTSISAYGLKPFNEHLDHVVAQLCYPDGPLFTLTASRVTEQKIRFVEVTALEAFVEADFLNKSISIHRRTSGEYLNHTSAGVKYHHESMIERIVVPTGEPLAIEINHFLQCISQNCTPCVSVREGMRALRLALRIRDQANEQNRQFAVQSEFAQVTN